MQQIKMQNTNINFRIPRYLKNKFIEVTEKQNQSYSIVLRQMIKDYIAKHQDIGEQDGK